MLLDVETAPLNGGPDTDALDPQHGRLVCIGVRTAEEQKVFAAPDERTLLADFRAWYAETCATLTSLKMKDPTPTIIGFNIRHFDIGFIAQRLKEHNMTLHGSFHVLDLMEAANGDVRVGFDETAARYGIKRSSPIRGKDVPALWRQGRIRDIIRHNQDDLQSEWALFKALEKRGLIPNGHSTDVT